MVDLLMYESVCIKQGAPMSFYYIDRKDLYRLNLPLNATEKLILDHIHKMANGGCILDMLQNMGIKIRHDYK